MLPSQPSSVHGLPSTHASDLPPWQLPSAQASFNVHALPSSQGATFFVNTQPFVGSQPSLVHGLPSSQVLLPRPWQVESAQMSPMVHALPSLQAAELLVYTQPDLALQLSSEHGLPSLQLIMAPGTQTPAWQRSPPVQTSPSLQSALLAVNTQPVLGLQLSVVQPLVSSQTVALPGRHAPDWHKSLVVQRFPSLHVLASSAVARQPVLGSQLSLVHGFLSSQVTGLPTHLPLLHSSPAVQALPSSQVPVVGGCWQLPAMQLSYVHGRLSLQTPGPGSSVWPLQLSSIKLHVSGAAFGASQAPNPAAPQLRFPPQVPSLLALLQAVPRPKVVARWSHTHTKSVLTHCWLLTLPTLTVA